MLGLGYVFIYLQVTFHELWNFSTLRVCACIFGEMEIIEKSACNMLMKLTPEVHLRWRREPEIIFHFFEGKTENKVDFSISCLSSKWLQGILAAIS